MTATPPPTPVEKLMELLRAGPFASLNSHNSIHNLPPQFGAVVSNVDVSRRYTEFVSAQGRQPFALIGPGPTYEFTAFDRLATDAQELFLWAAQDATFVTQTGYYDARTTFQGPVVGLFYFTQAVQFSTNLYTNVGQQYGGFAGQNSFSWQFPAPDANNFSLAAGSAGGLSAGTYTYAFTNFCTDASGANPFEQETSPSDTTNPASSITIDGTTQTSVTITAGGSGFSGTFDSGRTKYVTNIYRFHASPTGASQPFWAFIGQVPTGSTYIDSQPDENIAGNRNLVFHRDQPPCTEENPGVIFSHKERMWVFLTEESELDSGGSILQAQLWYSNYGVPWEFDDVDQVLLIGSSDVGGRVYGDYPVAGASIGSTAILWKALSTWVVFGDYPQTFTQRNIGQYGLIAPNSLGIGQGFAIGLYADGVYITDGNSMQYLSDQIQPTIDAIPLADQENAQGVYCDQKYYLSFPASGITLVYWMPTQQWYTLPYSTSSFTVVPFPTAIPYSRPRTLLGARIGSTFEDYWEYGDQDLNNPVVATWMTGRSDAGLPEYIKRPRFLVVEAPAQPDVVCAVTITAYGQGASAPFTTTITFDLTFGTYHCASIKEGIEGVELEMTIAVTNANAAAAVIHDVRIFGDPKFRFQLTDDWTAV